MTCIKRNCIFYFCFHFFFKRSNDSIFVVMPVRSKTTVDAIKYGYCYCFLAQCSIAAGKENLIILFLFIVIEAHSELGLKRHTFSRYYASLYVSAKINRIKYVFINLDNYWAQASSWFFLNDDNVSNNHTQFDRVRAYISIRLTSKMFLPMSR